MDDGPREPFRRGKDKEGDDDVDVDITEPFPDDSAIPPDPGLFDILEVGIVATDITVYLYKCFFE